MEGRRGESGGWTHARETRDKAKEDRDGDAYTAAADAENDNSNEKQ